MRPGNDWRGALAVGMLSFREFFVYPWDLFVTFFTQPVAFFSYACFILAVGSTTQWPLESLLAYYVMGWLLRMLFQQGIEHTVSARILSGELAVDLTRPLGIVPLYLGMSAGRLAARMTAYGIPGILLVCLAGGAVYLKPAGSWLPFMALTLNALLLQVTFALLLGWSAFYFSINAQLIWVTDMLIRLAGGLVVPVAFFPVQAATVLKSLPFYYFYGAPLAYWAHGGTWQTDWLAGLTWAVLLMAGGRILLTGGLRRLAVNGG